MIIDKEIAELYSLFFDGEPVSYTFIDTGRGEQDFRRTFIITEKSGVKRVIKLADNDFTFPEKIAVWQRAVTEYRKLGYYCPEIFCDKTGRFPTVRFDGRKCAAYAEEFSPYKTAEDRNDENAAKTDYDKYFADIWTMTAKVAGEYFDYSVYPSGYCLFERFCPSDKVYEVLEVALEWKKTADSLPEKFRTQTERIWRLWTENRDRLEKVYHTLPTSVFQADLNSTNILLDDEEKFVGVFDFNLCGRDVFLNYLIREIGDDEPEKERQRICQALETAREHYIFSQAEKDCVLMLYRCLKPLWNTLKVTDKTPDEEIRAQLDSAEHKLTGEFDFCKYM